MDVNKKRRNLRKISHRKKFSKNHKKFKMTEMTESKGKGQAKSQQPEMELTDLEAQIEKFRQRLRLLKSEELSEMEEKNAVIEKQQKRIKELKITIEGLQLALKRGHAADEKVLKKAFQKHYHDIGITRDKSAQEVADILEGRVFDLTKKRDLIKHELQKKEGFLEETRNQCNEMDKLCKVGAEDKGAAERAKQLENEYQKAQMRISDMEFVQRIYKDILDKLKADITDLPDRVDKLGKELKAQQADIESLFKRQAKGKEARDQARTMLTDTEIQALHARQEKDKVMAEFNQILQDKQQVANPELNKERAIAFEPNKLEAEKVLTDMKIEQEQSLESYKEAFEQIKTTTGVADIAEAEQRFTTQKAVRENLLKLKKQCEKKYRDIKLEKQYLETQMETMMGANLACPRTTLEETLGKYKREQEDQTRRKEAATSEYERITKTLAEVKTSLWQLCQLMQRHVGQEEELSDTIPDLSVSELADLIFRKYEDVLEVLKGQDIDNLMKRLKDEQPFFKKLDEKSTDLELRGKPKPQAEEESSSEDEELKKRTSLKKDAQNFADIKQKQKGRGHGFKL